MTVRRGGAPRAGQALPCPGALRRDGGRGYVRARRGTAEARCKVRCPYKPTQNVHTKK
ncbi:MAG: hypothetical protein LBM98_00460 [Oscillospiraceae bacterium]|nr:hypothetical protein [Oscillospiraceae bacterium]